MLAKRLFHHQKGAAFSIGLILSASAAAETPWMNDAPRAPDAVAPLLEPQAAPALGGFTVDPSQREASRLFYKSVYLASNGVPIGWTGDVATGDPGTTSQDFRDAMLRRINYFRAMAGVPADVAFLPTYNAKCQQAALMMSANNSLSHTPPTNWTHYTADGAEAAGKSNLFLGNFGPSAVTGFIEDFGTGNAQAGHRRWLLYPQTREMGSGDIPRDGGFASANAIWVIDSFFFSARPAVRDGFVAWPPRGFTPYQLVFPRWSFSHSNLDFSSATVALVRNGASVPVTIQSAVPGSGENSIVWIEDGRSATNPATLRAPAADTSTQVTVAGVRPLVAGQPQSFTYTVTVFDPAKLGADSLLTHAVGIYAGIVSAVPSSFATSGVVSVSVNRQGKFSGSLILGGKRFAFRGVFGDDGTAPEILLSRGRGLTPLRLTLQLPTAALPPAQMTGQVTEDGGFTAQINAPHTFYTAQRNPVAPQINPPADLIGPATVALDVSAIAGLTGHGWAAVTITKAGRIRFAGVLADGTKWSSNGPLSATGTAPVFAQLYRKTGSLLGTITLGGTAPRTLTGSLTWSRPAGVGTGVFAAGWPGGVAASLHGGAWTPPVRGTPWQPPAFTAGTGAATLSLSGGALAAPIPWDATFSATTKRVTVDPTAAGLNAKLAVKSASGLVGGTFQPLAGARAQKFTGVLLLGENRGLGFFIDATGSGKAAVSPR
ncbi:MAG: CAP domain-containing protein [Chthoniobacteraceae bacterium]